MNISIYKTTTPRFFASLIDGLILYTLVYIESFFTTSETPPLISILGLTLYYSVMHSYGIIFHTYFGQTIGKMLMKIRVLDIEGDSISFKQAFLRELPWITMSLGYFTSEVYQILTTGINETFRDNNLFLAVVYIVFIWLIAEIIVMLSNEKRRTIHDYIAGTVVVKTNL